MIDPTTLYALATLLLFVAFFSPFDFAVATVGVPDEAAPQKPERKPWEDLIMNKGGSSSAPDPDPAIGEAARANVQLGKEWLGFAEEQFAVANERQEGLDNLTKEITDRQLASQDRADQWSQEDRESSMADRDWSLGKRDELIDIAKEDRERGLQERDWADSTRDEMAERSAESRQAGREDRQWALQQRERMTGRADSLYDRSGEIQGHADQYREDARGDRQFAEQLREDYDEFRPVNERIRDDAMNWDSEGRLDNEAASARADVMQGAAQARQQSERQMASMGVNPNSGRFQSTSRSNDLNAALAATDAQNQARRQTRQEAVQMRQGAASLGQNVLGQSQQATQVANSTANTANNTDQLANQTTGLGMQADSQAQQAAQYGTSAIQGAGSQEAGMALNTANYGSSREGAGSTALNAGMRNAGFAAGQYSAPLGAAGLGINAGNSASGNAQANQASWMNNNSIMAQGYQGAGNMNQSAAGILNQQHGNQLNAWGMQQQADAQASAGWGQALGTVAGVAMMSSKDSKTKKKSADGALAAVDGLPVEAWEYKDGTKRDVPAGVIPPDDKRHVGPYAEDFARETGIGDGKTIPVQDAIGVTMKAVQELSSKVDRMGGKAKDKRRAVA